MPSLFERLRRGIANALRRPRRLEVLRTLTHPVYGEMRCLGFRPPAGERAPGFWMLYPPGFTHRLSVEFPSGSEFPTDEDLAALDRILGDLDGLFALCRAEVAAEYEDHAEKPMPADWRAVLRLDDINLPEPGVPNAEWHVNYWCEDLQHWIGVDFIGNTVDYIRVDG
jgi:hypothetical protein